MNILQEAELREIQRRTNQLLQSAAVLPKHEFDKFSIARALVGMGRQSVPGYEREVLEEFARREGLPFDAQRIVIPFSVFHPFSASRDLSKGIASAGGHSRGAVRTRAL